MPRVQVPGFLGPSNRLASVTADAEVTYNWLLEGTAPGTDPIRGVWGRQTPGRQPFCIGNNGWVRGLYTINDRTFAVVGTEFFEVFADGTHGTVWTVTADSFPASMCSNGSAGDQIFITSGLNGYIYDLGTDTLAIIADPQFPNGEARMGEFLDGYFLVLISESRRFQWSALEDGTSWDGLDVAERSTAADDLTAFIRVGRLLYLMGNRTSEPWHDQGDVNNPFAPIGGTLINQGNVAPFTTQRIGETLMWLGQNDAGRCVVYIGEANLSGRRVSTHAVERELNSVDSPGDSVAWVAQMDGHVFYQITVPGELDCSWTYDLTTDRWFKWAYWNTTLAQFEPARSYCHAFAFENVVGPGSGRQLVGDFLTPTIYDLSFDYLTDTLVTP